MKEAEKKETNPKAAMGIRKVSMSCLSSQSVALIAEAFKAEQLIEDDVVVIHTSEHWNAAVAHLMLFWEGQGDELEVPHLARSMARVMVIRDAELSDVLEDDRLNSDVEGVHITDLNAAAAAVIDKLPKCEPPFTELPEGTLGFKVETPIELDTPFHVLPWRVVLEMALGMMEGARKYGRHNYREMGVRASVYYDATKRHLADYIAGKEVDTESTLSHLTKALSSSQVLLDSMVMGNWIDDRPLRIK